MELVFSLLKKVLNVNKRLMLTIKTTDCDHNFMEICVIFTSLHKSRSFMHIGTTAVPN